MLSPQSDLVEQQGLTPFSPQGIPSGWFIHTIHLTGLRQDGEGQA